LHHHGKRSHPRANAIKHRLLRAFHPDDARWEERISTAARGIVGEALMWLGAATGVRQ
jgi:hypothetical protein